MIFFADRREGAVKSRFRNYAACAGSTSPSKTGCGRSMCGAITMVGSKSFLRPNDKRCSTHCSMNATSCSVHASDFPSIGSS
jgi:hypothetical protein